MTNTGLPNLLDIKTTQQEWHTKQEECKTANRTALFDTLNTASITTVVIEFDGEGDNGQITDIIAMIGDLTVPLPAIKIDTSRIQFVNNESIIHEDRSIKEVLEDICYDFLSEHHGGWENQDGAYGKFTIDIGARTVLLDYYERYIETNYSYHQF